MSWGVALMDDSGVSAGSTRRPSAAWSLSWLEARIPLALKLAVPVVLTTAVLAAVLATIVARSVSAQIQAGYERQATAVAGGVTAMYAEHPTDKALMNEYLAHVVKSNSDLVTIRILGLDRDTTVMASSTMSEIGMTGLADRQEQQAIWSGVGMQDEFDGPVLTTVEPLRAGDLLFGAVMIQSSKAGELAAINSVTLGIAVAALAAIAIESAFVLFTLYFGIIRRTRRIQHVVDAVASGDTTVRLPEGAHESAADEIINLARSVDQMIVSLDERRKGDVLIRTVTRKALEGTPADRLTVDALTATRDLLGLDSCVLTTVDEHGNPEHWIEGPAGRQPGGALPVWVSALTSVAVREKRTVLTNRLGRFARFAGDPGAPTDAQAAIVPLVRSGLGGHAIIAVAREGETIADGGLPVLDAVAATIAESLHMQAADNARAESAVKSRVMSAVSHEMRNPLNSILGFTGLVLGDGKSALTDKQRRQLGYVQTSAHNMLDLVNNYLDLARIRSGSLTLQYEAVDLRHFVEDAVTAAQPRAAAKSIAIRTSVPEGCSVRLDPTRVRQVLGNLLANAIAFTPAGGRVYVRARLVAASCRLVISDTGVGIKKEQRDLVFTEFAKIDAGTMAGGKGTGLGLTLTRAFVAAMGGTIRIYSRPGRGTTVSVSLPTSDATTRSSAA